MKKLILAGVLAAVALVSLPAASFAYGSGSPVVNGTVGPSKTVSVDFPAGYFSDTDTLTTVITCTAGEVTILNTEFVPVGIFHAPRLFPDPPYYQATASGAFSLQLTLPASDFGTCSVTVSGYNSGISGSADIAYVPAEAVAYTGFDAGLYIWTASGVIVLGGALISVMVTRRKAHAKASA